jgi:hypothetical protein
MHIGGVWRQLNMTGGSRILFENQMLASWLDSAVRRGVIYLTIATGDILSPLVNVKTIDGAVYPCHVMQKQQRPKL